MEDDDEFGDLYTDVLSTFPQPVVPPPQTEAPPPKPAFALPLPSDAPSSPDPNLRSSDGSGGGDDNLHGASLDYALTLAATSVASPERAADPGEAADKLGERKSAKEEVPIGVSRTWDLGTVPGVLERQDCVDGGVKDQVGVEGHDQTIVNTKCDGFDLQEDGDNPTGDLGSDPVIPGLLIHEACESESARNGDTNFTVRDEANGEGDDWDSDSEDDLQIVLNDHPRVPPTTDGSEDEDGEPLVIVGQDGAVHQKMEEQEWGEDVAQLAEKDGGEAAKANGGTAVAPKVGYSNHAYHPFHSQFKYVRPGAALTSGATSGAIGVSPGQVRPIGNMGPIGGRGRGDWRPTGIKAASPMQKNFHPGFGLSWGNNMSGRGLEFTLPSHKTIFEVDIDGFEEKPWKLLGVDISDFFNFGLTEDSWKDYCRQLEQLRLESTMQSKIRVYESGRTEQDYDPDLPPELAAAAGIHDVTAENANSVKTDARQSDMAKRSGPVRPPLPTGRAIQVEGGNGERLPSIDTRPPRVRDSDSIIEIVLQDSLDETSSAGNAVSEQPENDPQREDSSAALDEVAQVEAEYNDEFPCADTIGKRELVGKKPPFENSAPDLVCDGDGALPSAPDLPRGKASASYTGDFGPPNEDRRSKGRTHDKSSCVSPTQSSLDKRTSWSEEPVGSSDSKSSLLLSSPVAAGVAGEQCDDHKVEQDEHILADGIPEMTTVDMTFNSNKGTHLLHNVRKQKLSSRVEQPVLHESDGAEDLKATRTSDSRKERSGGSKDYQKSHEEAEDEVVQDQHCTHIGILELQHDEDTSLQRHDRGTKEDTERSRRVGKAGEDSYSNSTHHLHVKTEVLDRRKERDVPDGSWQKSDEDLLVKKRAEDTRKRDRSDDMGSRHRGKPRESDRSTKDEHPNSRKPMDNGIWRGNRDKESGSRHRDREDKSKSWHDNVDDLPSKRREEYPRRDYADKEEILHGQRESTNRRKRERDEVLDYRKKDDQARTRENPDDHHSIRHKDEGWFQRERSERPKERERDEWHRVKTNEENLSRREREEGRGALRSGREEKSWTIHTRLKDEYSSSDKDHPSKDTGRKSELLKRKDQIEDEIHSRHRGREDAHARGSQFSSEDRRSRRERSGTRNDRVVDNQRFQEKKHKENTRKSKESESGDHNNSGHSRRKQDDQSGRVTASSLKGKNEQGNTEQDIMVNRRSRKQREDASSDDELQDSRRGRSKLERWTSHKERDFSINNKSSTSLKDKEIDRNSNNGGSSVADKLSHESPKAVETTVDNQHQSAEERETGDLETKDADTKPAGDRHLDTVEKLKKRSERFKLPMPSEKEIATVKKIEDESLPSAPNEAPLDSTIKSERPPRKRRWIGN